MTKVSAFPLLSRIAHHAGVVEAEPALDEIKAVLAAVGINQRGWRLLLSFGDALLTPLMPHAHRSVSPSMPSFRKICALLRLIQQCEMDVLPPPELTRAWMRTRFPSAKQDLGDVPVGLFRASWLEAVRRQYEGYAFHLLLTEELPAVVRWFFSQSRPPTGQQLKKPWRWFHTHAENWSLRCEQHLSFDVWKPILPTAVSTRALHIIELLSPAAVEDEARCMRHCVDMFIPDCECGDYRVFSVQIIRTGERVATVGMIKDDRVWIIDDLRGQDNEDVDEMVWALAERARLYCNSVDTLQQRFRF
jgi:hypothetical protein